MGTGTLYIVLYVCIVGGWGGIALYYCQEEEERERDGWREEVGPPRTQI